MAGISEVRQVHYASNTTIQRKTAQAAQEDNM